MKNPARSLTVSLLNNVPSPGTVWKKVGQRIVANKYQIINVAGAVLVTFAILKILQDRRNSRKFQLSDYTEA